MSKRFPFTKRSIESLSPRDPDSPSREAEDSAVKCIGLKLRVCKGGRKFFQHRYRYMGRKKCPTIGEFPYVTAQDTRKAVHEHKTLLARQIDPSDERSQKTNDLTFSKLCEDFYIPHAKQHKKTWQEDVYKLDGKIEPAFGKYRLSSITASHYATLIKRMFNLAVKWGLLEKSPATSLDRFKEKPHRERYLTKAELPRFLMALDERGDGLSKAAVKL